MPVIAQYEKEKKILYITIFDHFDLTGIYDAFSKIDTQSPEAGILLDISSMTVPIGDMDFNMKTGEIRKIINQRKKAKTAIFTTNDFTFGVRTKYELLSEQMPVNIMLFDNFIDAEEWLT
jgi:hypothetical protein